MKRLLTIDLHKIFKNRSSKIILITYFVLLSLFALAAAVKINIGINEFQLAREGIFEFPYIWHFTTYSAAIFKLFIAIVVITMMTNEYSYGTLKQNLIDGLSKEEFILSKFFSLVLLAIVSTIFVFIFTLILGFIYSTDTSAAIIFTDLQYLLGYFFKLVGFFSMCLFLAVLVKKSAFALGLLFVWNIIEGVIGLVLTFSVSEKTADSIMSFFPLDAMSNLIKEPFSRLTIVKDMQESLNPMGDLKDYHVLFSDIAIVSVWTVIFIAASLFLLKKRDL
ncbi:ABC transporter permease [Flavobacterium ardleyense]|uniref:ABC transporter permease n=1 Tax=Flavobacterium ardleyense TaxID=2038737 RepID=UPI00298CB709|nr:ABC transporter permease subunit [Flavobacterium ardleyense]